MSGCYANSVSGTNDVSPMCLYIGRAWKQDGGFIIIQVARSECYLSVFLEYQYCLSQWDANKAHQQQQNVNVVKQKRSKAATNQKGPFQSFFSLSSSALMSEAIRVIPAWLRRNSWMLQLLRNGMCCAVFLGTPLYMLPIGCHFVELMNEHDHNPSSRTHTANVHWVHKNRHKSFNKE